MADVQDSVKLQALGSVMCARFEQYKKARYAKELQWLKNLRQFIGMYDPETEGTLRKGGSRAYPRVTRTKLMGTAARIMEMMFPQSEKNWGIDASKRPNLSVEDMNSAQQAAIAQKQSDGTQGPPTQDELQFAVQKLAEDKAFSMSVDMEDQLDEMDYIQIARKVVFSGLLYGIGLAKGPYTVQDQTRIWQTDSNGNWVVNDQKTPRPRYEFLSVWNYYPDFTAKTRAEMTMEFERNPISKHALLDLKNRADYMPAQIDEVLRRYPSGNYKEEHWEQALRANNKSDRENTPAITDKFELIDGWGHVMGEELIAAGDSTAVAGTMYMAWVSQIGDVIIKAIQIPYASQKSPISSFCYEDNDMNVLGSGFPEVIRDSQMAVCDAARMLLDNASVVCGPQLEIDVDLLVEGSTLDLYAFKMWLKEGSKGQPTNAGGRAVQNIQIDGHLTELQAVMEFFMQLADTEAALPPPAMGDVSGQGKEAYRTSGGTSMLLGAAALPIRDVVRNFDVFTTSFIGSLYNWNMQFGTNQFSKGDYQIIARGSTSLIAKEVRANTLDTLNQTMTGDDRDHLDERRLLEERFKAHDLPLDLLVTMQVVTARRNAKAQAQQAEQDLANETAKANVRNLLSEAAMNLAKAGKDANSGAVDLFNSLIKALTDEAPEPKAPAAASAD